LTMPRDAEILMVAAQGDVPTLWARVMPEQEKQQRRFKLRGTGHAVDMDCQHVGSFMMRGGLLVFHLFEVIGADPRD
jgi:hypothetical protein